MAGAAGGFSEEHFREAYAELQQLVGAGAGWQLLVETMNISVYGRRDKRTGLYEYKVFGVLEDCPPDVLVAVYMDLDYRKQWDEYIEELYEQEYNGQTVIYCKVKYPFPMSKRDYVYIQQLQELDTTRGKIYMVVSQSTSVPQLPEKRGVIRVKQYKQSLAIERDGNGGSKGGLIPSWIINRAVQVRSQEA
ncbi:phosphatidylcholine transfer protein isoform X5 [Eulemur rufifrons]|uniref:phosphatidylcholine transfer protein isoform X5 n=1 Tax=Eulemur rufifrons TaxID=859984 RepID=UPI003742C0DF